MKRFQAMLGVLLALMLCCTALPVAAAPVATASVGTVQAARGETVTVPVSITQVSGIGAIALHMYYDGNVLECVDAQVTGIMNDMDMATANTTPSSHPNEVWLTGMGLEGMTGSGEIMTITFKVKEDAPAGLSTIGFTEEGQELVSGSPIEALELGFTDGGIVVKEGAAVTPEATTTVGETPDAAATSATEEAPVTQAPTVTRPNGEAVTLPTSVAVSHADGTAVTDAQGNIVTMDAIAIFVEEATGKPGDKVTVNVSISAVTDLTALSISVGFDEEALTFVDGECQGLLKDSMSFSAVTNDNKALVSIAGTNPQPVSGEGVVATLTFEINKQATSGEHRLVLDPEPLLLANDIEIPFAVYGGSVTVEGGASAVGSSAGGYIAVGIVLVIAVLVLIVLLVLRKKSPKSEAKTIESQPAQPKTVLPTDISEDLDDVDDSDE